MLFIDPDANTRVVDFTVFDALPDQCYDDSGAPACFLLGIGRAVIDDHDYVEVAATNFHTYHSTLARIPLADPTTVTWRLDQLDFSGTSSNGTCRRTCGDAGPVPKACELDEVHEFLVVDEDPAAQWVNILTTDPGNSRIAMVHLEYADGNSCGQVEWVLDDSNPDWPSPAAWPNGIQLLHEEEGTFLINSFWGEDAKDGNHRGGIYLWDLNSPTPEAVWRYPNDSASSAPYLNAPHGVRLHLDPVTQSRYVLYAHSFGASNAWTGGGGGSWGIARVDDLTAPPDYLGEWILPRNYDRLNFSRELELLPDGTFLGIESGCYFVLTPDNSCPAAVYWFRPGQLPSSDRSGVFTQNHRTQNMVTLQSQEVYKEVTCGLHLIFGADEVPSEAFGQELRAAVAQGGTACPE